MAAGKTLVRIFFKIILAVAIPVYLAALVFVGIGIYLHNNNDFIMPSISVDDVDISLLTREEALRAIDLQAYDERGRGVEVTVAFPDGSELSVTGEDVQFANDARLLVDAAYSRGRGYGFIEDTTDFIQRMFGVYVLDAMPERYEVHYEFDKELLRACVDEFTGGYNSVLEGSTPIIYSDRIVIVKGAGQVCASETDVYNLVYNGLLESLAGGYPVGISYALPDVGANRAELTAIRQKIYAQALSAEYDPDTKTISESSVGIDFDLIGAIALLDGAESGKVVSIGMKYTDPEVTREYLEGLLFRDLIGECVTKIGGSANRLNNVILSSEAVNGIVLEPGERFSFNQVVGKRTTANGYKSAPAFSGGQTVQAIGGGICQVSSTIYSAIKDTDIRVTERHAHGQPITYLPRGRDATVSWGTLDFKFENNTEYPLRVDVEVDERTLTVKVFGTLSVIEETMVLGAGIEPADNAL